MADPAPFIVAAATGGIMAVLIFLTRNARANAWVKKHSRTAYIAGGILFGIGVAGFAAIIVPVADVAGPPDVSALLFWSLLTALIAGFLLILVPLSLYLGAWVAMLLDRAGKLR